MKSKSQTEAYGGNLFPARETLHREYAGECTIFDFSTSYPNPHRKVTYTRAELEYKKKLEQS